MIVSVYDIYSIIVHMYTLLFCLQEVEECVDIPKEICTKSRRNPKKVKKPVIKNWCYTPSAATGLDLPAEFE